MCFFSGINYMCCPSNEPSIDIQPTCPTPALTVLDSYGIPLKCNPQTRSCLKVHSQFHKKLSLICEEFTSAFYYTAFDNVGTKSDKRVSQKRNFHTTIAYEESALDCPQKSNSLTKSDGSRTLCNTSTECPGKDAFCYGTVARSICCEWYNIPDHGVGEDPLGTVDSSILVECVSTLTQQPSSIRMSSSARFCGRMYS
ncbi:unnamed protein product [Angiostrongylus costaricensis]|uniref:Thyroglobulin type-1 domain-containing protein n=1 Tax=Angiostrongylus costaricensis TaxID=334426 RepID=A0A0R3PS07_ANGCS|nr:unnamed protein product [Angiostrongylus costaricensis]